MKNLTIPTCHLVMLAELDDKDAGLMVKAIAQYANEGIAPTFSNGALKAIFSLFRSVIDAQIESATKRSEINSNNAQSKKSSAKKKSSKKTTDAVVIEETKSESEQIVHVATKLIALEDFESIYPKVGSFRDESLNILASFSEEKKQKALDYVPYYIEGHPNTSELLYLNQYLKSELWDK